MIKVMVVEDELPLLRGIKNMIESLHPDFKVVKAARNGQEALGFLEREAVDAIFTDINMPMMDGIELLKRICTVKPAIQTVIISGYDDFNYATKAMRYQAIDYLLKPIDRGELAEVLARIEGEYKRRHGEKKSKVLADMVYGNGKEGAESSLFETVYPVYLCAGAFCSNNTEESTPGNEYWRANDLKAIAAEALGSEEGVFCFWGKSLNEMILLLEGSCPLDVGGLAGRILGRLEPSLPVAAACGEPLNDIGQVKTALGSLREQIRNQGIFGETGMVSRFSNRAPFLLSVSAEEALKLAAQNGRFEEFRGIVLNIRDQMKLARVTQRDLEQALWLVFTAFERAGSNSGGLYLDMTQLLAYAHSLDQLFEDFLLLCRDMFQEDGAGDSHELMKQVDSYIVSHVREPINTIMLAERFGLVPPYLSRLFKEYKGKSPSQYIQEIRMDSAREMLSLCPEMKSKEIAEALGYTNPLYFSKAFKKYVGVYPSEYRAQQEKRQADEKNGEEKNNDE